MPDWIVTGGCVALLVLGIVFSAKAIGGASSYDLGTYSDDPYGDVEVLEVDEADYGDTDEIVPEEVYEVDAYRYSGGVTTLADIADAIDPDYFSNELQVYRMGSDQKMEQIYQTSGSTHTPIQATGMISDRNVVMVGWLEEDGKIHGRYHNENGINLDFNGYISPDNSLYIQLGHDSEKSDWYLHPVASELPSDQCRYEGKWGKSGKYSYLTFSQR